MDVMPPCFACQGTAASELQGTGLLNIAGEKAGYSGILGHPTVLKIKSSLCCSFFIKIYLKLIFLLHFLIKCDIVFRHMGH